MVFQNTPGTEAPAEMNTWFPQFKAFWAAENITATIHNIYTLRGALVRDPLKWSKDINEALYRFGPQAEVMFSAHSWPRWGNARIQDVMRTQRDVYANLNNEVLHLANQGVTINEIHNVYRLPPSLQQQWAARSYHGSEEHNSRAVINRYLGYWDGNPTTLIPAVAGDSAPLYVEMMGGSEKILARVARAVRLRRVPARDGDPQQAGLRRARQPGGQGPARGLPSNRSATRRRAPACATASWPPRWNCARAFRRPDAALGGPDTVRAHVDRALARLPRHPARQPQGRRLASSINLVTPDTGEKFVLELSNSTLTNIAGYQAPNADLTVTINRADLEPVMMRKATFASQAAAGRASLAGNARGAEAADGVPRRFRSVLRDHAGHESCCCADAVNGPRRNRKERQRHATNDRSLRRRHRLPEAPCSGVLLACVALPGARVPRTSCRAGVTGRAKRASWASCSGH